MKIGYFTTCLPYKNPKTSESIKPSMDGGVENVAFDLAIQMEKLGHEIFIFTTSNESEESIEKYGDITIFRYKKDFTIGQSPFSFQLLYKPLFSGINLDIIHVHMGNQPAPIAATLYAKKMKKPFVVTYHGDYTGNYGGIGRRIGIFLQNHYLCNYILSHANRIIGLSNEHVNQSKYLQKHTSSIEIIPNGVNLQEFDIKYTKDECRNLLGIPTDKQIILFVGSLTPRKAPDVAINSLNQIMQSIPNVMLVLVGDGSFKEELESNSNRSMLKNNVRFTGFVTEDIKTLYYKAADVFVLPSLSEALPLVLLEASAAGLPMVVSDLECFRAIIKDGYNGLFSKTGDENDLAEKIITLLKNEDMRFEMGNNAQNKIKSENSWESVAKTTEALYKDLVYDN